MTARTIVINATEIHGKEPPHDDLAHGEAPPIQGDNPVVFHIGLAGEEGEPRDLYLMRDGYPSQVIEMGELVNAWLVANGHHHEPSASTSSPFPPAADRFQNLPPRLVRWITGREGQGEARLLTVARQMAADIQAAINLDTIAERNRNQQGLEGSYLVSPELTVLAGALWHSVTTQAALLEIPAVENWAETLANEAISRAAFTADERAVVRREMRGR